MASASYLLQLFRWENWWHQSPLRSNFMQEQRLNFLTKEMTACPEGVSLWKVRQGEGYVFFWDILILSIFSQSTKIDENVFAIWRTDDLAHILFTNRSIYRQFSTDDTTRTNRPAGCETPSYQPFFNSMSIDICRSENFNGVQFFWLFKIVMMPV
jgi:hypothetical protein